MTACTPSPCSNLTRTARRSRAVIRIVFDAADSAAELAAAIAAAINAASQLGYNGNGRRVRRAIEPGGSAGCPRHASRCSRSSNLVRIVGNGGADESVDTLADNRPYLLGVDSAKLPLADGAGLIVPQGVTVMIDAGALLKLMAANVDVGTSALGANRGAGALQVLGTPDAAVYFRSYRNDDVGGDSDGSGEAPKSGDWGGLVFRDDSGHGAGRDLPELGQPCRPQERRRQSPGGLGGTDLHTGRHDQCSTHHFVFRDSQQCRRGDGGQPEQLRGFAGPHRSGHSRQSARGQQHQRSVRADSHAIGRGARASRRVPLGGTTPT